MAAGVRVAVRGVGEADGDWTTVGVTGMAIVGAGIRVAVRGVGEVDGDWTTVGVISVAIVGAGVMEGWVGVARERSHPAKHANASANIRFGARQGRMGYPSASQYVCLHPRSSPTASKAASA